MLETVRIKTISDVDYSEKKYEIVIDTSLCTLDKLCKYIDLSIVYMFNSYYKYGYEIMDEACIPFVIKNNIMCWNVPYSETTIKEFIHTHNIKDYIEINTNVVAASGLGALLGQGWNVAIEFLEHHKAESIELFSIIKFLLKALVSIKSKFEQKDVGLLQVIEATYLRYSWSSSELASMLEISKEEAKKLLIGLGYVWNRYNQMYELCEGKYENSWVIYDMIKRNEVEYLMNKC